MKASLVSLALGVALVCFGAIDASAFESKGRGAADCGSCHTLSREEASTILRGWVDNVLSVEMSPVRGMWVVDIEKQGRKIPIYIDFSKSYLVSGQVIRLATKEDLIGARAMKLNEVNVDASRIPLEGALVLGKPSAKRKVVVFSDPDCHFCAKLHGEMRTVVEKNPQVAFYIKLYSRNNNAAAIEKAKSVICANSMARLEDAYARKPLPPPACTTGAPEETFKLAESLNIRGTPTIVLPDGRLVTGYRNADALLKLIEEGSGAAGAAAPKK